MLRDPTRLLIPIFKMAKYDLNKQKSKFSSTFNQIFKRAKLKLLCAPSSIYTINFIAIAIRTIQNLRCHLGEDNVLVLNVCGSIVPITMTVKLIISIENAESMFD